MIRISLLSLFILCMSNSKAQDVEYKKGMIKVDGEDYLRLEVKKENFGLTKSFEVYSLSDKKIIIAAVATEFEQDKRDNSYMFYRLTFLTSNQIGIFKIPSLSQEKGFAKLIGGSGIMAKDTTNDAKVREFIAAKGASPRIAVDYTIVSRDRAWPIDILKDKTIQQNSKIIGSFKNMGFYNERDSYEFLLPSGVVIAKLSFTGGNNAQNFEVFTAKDNLKRLALIPTSDKIILADASIDKNQFALKRIVKWLVDNQYL